MKYRSYIHKSRTKILGRFQIRTRSIRGHCGSYSTLRTKHIIPLEIDGALTKILVKDGVTGLFCVENAVSYWSYSRQNGHFGHIMAKFGLN